MKPTLTIDLQEYLKLKEENEKIKNAIRDRSSISNSCEGWVIYSDNEMIKLLFDKIEKLSKDLYTAREDIRIQKEKTKEAQLDATRLSKELLEIKSKPVKRWF